MILDNMSAVTMVTVNFYINKFIKYVYRDTR